jgi:hypothetical protein
MNKKAITITSLNVRSLGKNSPKQKEIRGWVTSLAMLPQIMLLQEHHLGEADYLTSTKGVELWKGASFWNHNIPMGRLQRMSLSTSILVDKPFTPQITSNGILLEGRTQYITLKLLNNKNLTIVNIYSARTSNEPTLMWKQPSKANFDTSHVIIREDFNHLKEIDQRGKAGGCFMMRREAASWHHMML